jgi:hypothetical protein
VVKKGFQIRALRVLRRVFVSFFTILADFRQVLNHRNSVIFIHDRTSIVSDASHATRLDGYLSGFKVSIKGFSGKRTRRASCPNDAPPKYFPTGSYVAGPNYPNCKAPVQLPEGLTNSGKSPGRRNGRHQAQQKAQKSPKHLPSAIFQLPRRARSQQLSQNQGCLVPPR